MRRDDVNVGDEVIYVARDGLTSKEHNVTVIRKTLLSVEIRFQDNTTKVVRYPSIYAKE